MTKFGVDISSFNGDINFTMIKDQIDFVIIRCGYGNDSESQDDSRYEANVQQCERLGIPYGIYLYSYALNLEDADSEVRHCLRQAKKANPSYGVWFDMEDGDGYKASRGFPSKNMLVSICERFLSGMEEAGYYAGLYASLSWLNGYLNDSRLNRFDKWVAQWAPVNTYTGLSFRSFIHNCGFYQLYNKQLSKNAQNIRNPDSLFGIIKVTKQKPTKQKKRGLLMLNSTTNTYTLKRKILSFSNKISRHLSKPERKFTADITYGLLASGSCLLTDVVDQLHESSKKINIVDRLSRHLEKGTPGKAVASYLHTIKKWVPDEPVIHIDDSDVVKPDGYKFEALGIVRDGSESTSTKNVYKKGYHVTEACVLTSSNHPVSIFSRIHSSSERDYKSANTITFQAMEQGAALFKKATFAMDRGYDDNKMFLKMDELGQDYVIRLKSNRKLLYHNKWTMATELRNRRKGKVKTNVFYKGKDHEAYLSHVKVQITASRKDIYLVLVYGITEHPMMLATNKEIKSKEDVIRVARTYFSRWKIEEYFRCKKQMFQFENFRVRKLVSINALNFYITLCMAFLAIISMESETNALKVSIIKSANPIKEKVFFCYYRLAKGISGILSYAKEGVRLWFRTKRPAYRQLCLKLVA